MNLVLVSNYLNDHMLPLCEAFVKNSAVDKFTFIATEPFGEERKKMGFADVQDGAAYVFKAYGSAEAEREALHIVETADVAIVAHAPDEYIHVRMKENRITFSCSERFYKLGLWRRFVPSSYAKKKMRFLQYSDKKLYFLTIGAYAPYDLHLVGVPLEKCFQWAYFPKTVSFEIDKIAQKNENKKLKLFWAGRMQQVKHPETAIEVASRLRQAGIDFELNMAGDGALMNKARKQVQNHSLEDCVHLLGNCSPEKVQKYMQESNVFLFTSDYGEGWGAVLSEAMAAGCVPIASAAAGASEILIQNGVNGITFKTGQVCTDAAIDLARNPEKRKQMAKEAYQMVNEVWTPENAAENFCRFVLLGERRTEQGPMRNAELLNAKNFFHTKR